MRTTRSIHPIPELSDGFRVPAHSLCLPLAKAIFSKLDLVARLWLDIGHLRRSRFTPDPASAFGALLKVLLGH